MKHLCRDSWPPGLDFKPGASKCDVGVLKARQRRSFRDVCTQPEDYKMQ
jgi:hypothetical protein